MWALDSPLPNISALSTLSLWAGASQNRESFRAWRCQSHRLLPHLWGLRAQGPPLPRQAGQEAKDNGSRQSFHPEISKRHLINPAQVGDFLWSPFGGVWSGTNSSQILAWIGGQGLPECSSCLGPGTLEDWRSGGADTKFGKVRGQRISREPKFETCRGQSLIHLISLLTDVFKLKQRLDLTTMWSERGQTQGCTVHVSIHMKVKNMQKNKTKQKIRSLKSVIPLPLGGLVQKGAQ